jgi:hypothetical protein
MSERKDIDRLFQERFKDFEAAPPPGAWNNIEKKLEPQKKRRAAGWIFYSGIAAGIAMLFSLVYYGATFNDSTIKEQLVNEEPIKVEPTQENKDFNKDLNKNSENSSPLNSTNSENNVAGASASETTGVTSRQLTQKAKNRGDALAETAVNNKSSTSNEAAQKQNELASSTERDNHTARNNAQKKIKNDNTKSAGDTQKTLKNKNALPSYANSKNQKPATEVQKINSSSKLNEIIDNPVIDSSNPSNAVAENESNLLEKKDSLQSNKLLEDALAQKDIEKDSLDLKGNLGSRFKGSTLVAPIYSNSSGSSVNGDVANNDRSAGYNLSYGVALGYKLNERWTVRAGVHKVDVSYNTQGVSYNTTILPSDTFGTSFNANDISNAATTGGASGVSTGSQEVVANSFKGFQGELSQQLGYIEVPLEIRYNLTKTRVRVSMTGGFSALFLQENNVRIVGNNQRLELGNDDNFREFNQSANFGIGLDYGITEQLGIMLEPMFKYQLSALERNTADFRPYTIGLYSGLTYTF